MASVGLDGKPGPVSHVMPPQTTQNLYVGDGSLIVFDVPVAQGNVGDTVVGDYRTVPEIGTPRVIASIRTPSLFQPGSHGRPRAGPFEPTIVADIGVNGDIAHSNGPEYVVHVFPATGSPWRLEVQAPKRIVSQTNRDSVETATLKIFRAANIASLPPLVRAQFAIKRTTFPPLTGIRVLRDGTLWIRPVPAAGATVARWDVFSRDGTRVGRATLPLSASVRDGTRDSLLDVELNEDDVPSVVRYKVN